MFCPDCGKQITDTARVCGYCGFKIPEKPTPPPPPVEQAAPAPAELRTESVEERLSSPPASPFEKPDPGKVPKGAKGKNPKKEPLVIKEVSSAAAIKHPRKPFSTRTWGLIGVVVVLLAVAGLFTWRGIRFSQTIWLPQFSLAQAFTWPPGQHEYNFKGVSDTAACQLEEFESEPVFITVSATQTLLSGEIYLRPYYMSETRTGEDRLSGIHPDQETLPVISLWNSQSEDKFLTHSEAKDYLEACTVLFRWDGGSWIKLDVEQVVEADF